MNGNEHSLKEVIKELFKTYHIDSKVYEVQIKEIWEKAMGKTIARYTTDLKLKDGILTIYLNSAPLRQDLGYNRDSILTRINEEFGERVVREVVIR